MRKAFAEKYLDISKLTLTTVNEFIKKVIVYPLEKSSGKRAQEIRIIFSILDETELPEINSSVTIGQAYKHRKTA